MVTLTVILVVLTAILVIIGINGNKEIRKFPKAKNGKITVEVIKGIVKTLIAIGVSLSTSYAVVMILDMHVIQVDRKCERV